MLKTPSSSHLFFIKKIFKKKPCPAAILAHRKWLAAGRAFDNSSYQQINESFKVEAPCFRSLCSMPMPGFN
jgi:hypothetical protein